jgi:hypothetical protein
MVWIVLEISSFLVADSSSSAWSGGAILCYGVYGSPVVCHWREPIISRVLGHNRWPAVPGVYYCDNSIGGVGS